MAAKSTLGDVALAVANVARVAEHLAQRRRDLGRVQQAARDLVEQRREQVVVLPVDEHDVDRLVPQRLRALEAAEPATDDHDTRDGRGTEATIGTVECGFRNGLTDTYRAGAAPIGD